jgi:NhaP-type Na+/H+ or K+/H+ antiporter
LLKNHNTIRRNLNSLFADRIEKTVLTSPIIFTTVGIVLGVTLPNRSTQVAAHEAALLVAEIALVPLLFTEASKVGLRSVKKFVSLPARLLLLALFLKIRFKTSLFYNLWESKWALGCWSGWRLGMWAAGW